MVNTTAFMHYLHNTPAHANTNKEIYLHRREALFRNWIFAGKAESHQSSKGKKWRRYNNENTLNRTKHSSKDT